MRASVSPLLERHADVLLVGLPSDVVHASRLLGIPHGDLTERDAQPLLDRCEHFGVGAWLPGLPYRACQDSWECGAIRDGLSQLGSSGLDVGCVLMGRAPRVRSIRSGAPTSTSASLQGVWFGRPEFSFVSTYDLDDLILPSSYATWDTLWNDSHPLIRGALLDSMWSVKVLARHKQAWCQAGERLLRHHAIDALLPPAQEAGMLRF